jgi:hypothetical protein
MKTPAVVLFALCALACGDAKDKAEERAAEARDKTSSLLDKASTLEKELEQKKGVVTAKVFDATMVALRVKGELDKVRKVSGEYDIDVSTEGADDAAMKQHEAKIAAMPHVTVGELTVGYEEDQNRSLRGTTFARHFRAIWAHGGKKVAVSYYTKEELDAQAFAKLLESLVPLVQGAVGG